MSSPPRPWPGRTQPTPDARAQLTDDIIASQQVRAVCNARTLESEPNVAKRSDLRERGQVPRRREVLTDPGKRMAKLGIEAGYDTRLDVFHLEPLEPWTSPHPAVGKRIYADIMRGVEGADLLSNYNGIELDEAVWLQDEQLLACPDRLHLVPVSDARAKAGRRYPGAPVPDMRAKIGKILGLSLAKLRVLKAFSVIFAGRSGRRGRQPGQRTAAGWRLAAREVCEVANRQQGKGFDLHEHRYMSVDACRRAIAALIADGLLMVVEEYRAVRERRSWRTIPRVFGALARGLAREPRGCPPAEGTPCAPG